MNIFIMKIFQSLATNLLAHSNRTAVMLLASVHIPSMSILLLLLVVLILCYCKPGPGFAQLAQQIVNYTHPSFKMIKTIHRHYTLDIPRSSAKQPPHKTWSTPTPLVLEQNSSDEST